MPHHQLVEGAVIALPGAGDQVGVVHVRFRHADAGAVGARWEGIGTARDG